MATDNRKLLIEPKAKQLVAKLMRNLAARGRGSEVFWQLLWLPETVAKPSTLFAACGRFISFSASATAAALQFRLCGLTWWPACARDTRTESYLMRVKSPSLSVSLCVRTSVSVGLPGCLRSLKTIRNKSKKGCYL